MNKDDILKDFDTLAEAKRKGAVNLKLCLGFALVVVVLVLAWGLVVNFTALDKVVVVERSGEYLKTHAEDSEALFLALVKKTCAEATGYANSFDRLNLKKNQAHAAFYVNKNDLNAVFSKYYNDKAQKEEWNMSLDKNKLNRDYLYGRLLAVFEKLEIDAMKSRYGYTDNDIRETHADKLWNFYCAKPESGAANINGALRPYLKYLPDTRKNFYLGLIGEIMGKIGETADKIRNKSLEPCYLMGYYDQRNDLYTSKKDKQEEDK